ncbi:hypothetical protein VOA_001863 [Vibrio sp. RC586]|uniref:hypothetical protein n=1 Tax=Vibrio sp. RC586 TaxID=675815 RepID=UPI0001BB8055|nr:hypothetical protein [Vibrio sp. RC586]EEY99513.1 hypothetical protein VOA_001863 [Vibrio sp. RC586]
MADFSTAFNGSLYGTEHRTTDALFPIASVLFSAEPTAIAWYKCAHSLLKQDQIPDHYL